MKKQKRVICRKQVKRHTVKHWWYAIYNEAGRYANLNHLSDFRPVG